MIEITMFNLMSIKLLNSNDFLDKEAFSHLD